MCAMSLACVQDCMRSWKPWCKGLIMDRLADWVSVRMWNLWAAIFTGCDAAIGSVGNVWLCHERKTSWHGQLRSLAREELFQKTWWINGARDILSFPFRQAAALYVFLVRLNWGGRPRWLIILFAESLKCKHRERLRVLCQSIPWFRDQPGKSLNSLILGVRINAMGHP